VAKSATIASTGRRTMQASATRSFRFMSPLGSFSL
jgi:hypothetical protein